jgi:anti-sigma-K factor RskA
VNDRRFLTNDELDDALAGYSLGALSPDEVDAVEGHLDAPHVQSALDEYRDTVAALALAAPLRRPPADLGPRLAARLDEPQRSVAIGRSSTLARGRLLVWRQLTPWLATAAMLLVSVGLGFRVWQQQSQLNELQAVLTTPQVVSMEAGEVAPSAQGRFYLAPDTHRGVLLVVDMPPLTPDTCYQLWLVGKDDVRDNGGTFRVDERGYAAFLVNAPRPMKDYKRIGVTTEPHGGSPGPPSGRVVGASLEQTTPVDWYQ